MPKKKSSKTSHPVTKKKHTSLLRKLLYAGGCIAICIVGGYTAYSVYLYENSQEEAEGFFVCNEEKTDCEVSQHIHADIDMRVCGKEIVFSKETGNTSKQHTHKEKNKLHWHARLKADPETQEPLDPSPLFISAFLSEMKYAFPATCPNNATPTMNVTVNETPIETLDTRWYDGDRIHISYE